MNPQMVHNAAKITLEEGGVAEDALRHEEAALAHLEELPGAHVLENELIL